MEQATKPKDPLCHRFCIHNHSFSPAVVTRISRAAPPALLVAAPLWKLGQERCNVTKHATHFRMRTVRMLYMVCATESPKMH